MGFRYVPTLDGSRGREGGSRSIGRITPTTVRHDGAEGRL